MKTSQLNLVPGNRLAVFALLLATGTHLLAQSSPLPPGIADFTGRIAHNHWHLFGAEQRADWDRLNRAIREADRELRPDNDDSARADATNRARATASTVRERVRSAPSLVRIDLTASDPMLTPSEPLALPGTTGALLLEVSSGPGDDGTVDVADRRSSAAPGQ